MDWLFLRGLSREQRHWGGFPARFREVVPGARVHFLDLPGAGTEAHRASPASVRAIMEDLRGRFLPLREAHPGPWALLGMSLGGMVAMAWCADHPGDFSRVVLSNTSAADVGRPWDRMRPRALAMVAQALVARDPVARNRAILSVVTRRVRDLDAVAGRWAEIERSAPVARAAVLRQLAAAARFRAPARLPLPTLILAGGGDELASPACARALAARFGAPLAVHPDGGHELALDAPEWLAEQVASWIGAPR